MINLEGTRKPIVAAILVLTLVSGCGTSTPAPISEVPTASATTEPLPATPMPPTTTPRPSPAPDSLVRILFIGNSLTFYNGGLDMAMNLLARSAVPPLEIESDSECLAGATLSVMWKFSDARKRISEDDYDVVVLQGDIPETDVEGFQEYARLFIDEIKAAGAEPVLFMAWPYERHGWITMDEIAQAHSEIAIESGVDIAPVGLVWQQAMEERPELDMYHSDAEHPSVYGTFLAVNVVYATVFGESPVGLAYRPPERRYSLRNGSHTEGVTDEEASFLQQIAWEAVQAYQPEP